MSTQDSDFFRTFTLVMVGLGVFFVIIIVAANWVSSGSNDNSNDPRVQAQIEETIQPVGSVNQKLSAAAAKPAAGEASVNGQQAYQQACFACHGTGAAGAPKLGDKGEWSARIAQGKDTLYKHAIEGKGTMPPKGGSQLSDDAIKVVVDYMIAESK